MMRLLVALMAGVIVGLIVFGLSTAAQANIPQAILQAGAATGATIVIVLQMMKALNQDE